MSKQRSRYLAFFRELVFFFTILLTAAAIPTVIPANLDPILERRNSNEGRKSDKWLSSVNIIDSEAFTLVDMVTSIIKSIIEHDKSERLENDSEETLPPYSDAVVLKFVFNFQFKNRSSLNASKATTSPTLSSGDTTESSPVPAIDSESYDVKQSIVEKYLNNMVNTTDQICNDLNQVQNNLWNALKSQLLTQLNQNDGVVLWNQRLQFWIFCTVIPNLNVSIVTTLVNDSTNSYPSRICCPFDALGVGNITRSPIEYEDYIPTSVVKMLVDEVILLKSRDLNRTKVLYGTESTEFKTSLTLNALRSGLWWPSLRKKTKFLRDSARQESDVDPDDIADIDLFVMGEPEYKQACKRIRQQLPPFFILFYLVLSLSNFDIQLRLSSTGEESLDDNNCKAICCDSIYVDYSFCTDSTFHCESVLFQNGD